MIDDNQDYEQASPVDVPMIHDNVEQPPVEQTSAVEVPLEQAETTEEQVAEAGQETTVPEELPYQAQNFKTLRQDREKIVKERDEALKRNRELESRLKPTEELVEEEDEFGLASDDLVEGRHVKSLEKKINKLNRAMEVTRQQAILSSAENRLRNKFTDFSAVVNDDTLDVLKISYPEIVKSMENSEDIYSIGVTAYTLIKQFGIYKEDNFQEDRSKIQRNAAKPRPLSSISPQRGSTPLSQANAFAGGLTPELAKALRTEMAEARKNR